MADDARHDARERHSGIWAINGVAATGARHGALPDPAPRPLLRAGDAQRHRLAPPDAPARPRLPGDRPRRTADPPPGMAGHRADGAARAGRDRLRRRQSRRLDVPLPHPGAPGRRDDGRDPGGVSRPHANRWKGDALCVSCLL